MNRGKGKKEKLEKHLKFFFLQTALCMRHILHIIIDKQLKGINDMVTKYMMECGRDRNVKDELDAC